MSERQCNLCNQERMPQLIYCFEHADKGTLAALIDQLFARVTELETALLKMPAVKAHDGIEFCSAYQGEPCNCGHDIIARAFGFEPDIARPHLNLDFYKPLT